MIVPWLVTSELYAAGVTIPKNGTTPRVRQLHAENISHVTANQRHDHPRNEILEADDLVIRRVQIFAEETFFSMGVTALSF